MLSVMLVHRAKPVTNVRPDCTAYRAKHNTNHTYSQLMTSYIVVFLRVNS